MQTLANKIKENNLEIQKYEKPYYEARETQNKLIRSINHDLEDIQICLDSESMKFNLFFCGFKFESIELVNLHLITSKNITDSLLKRYKDLEDIEIIINSAIQIKRIEDDILQLKMNLEKLLV